ncbi:MAG: hypothetical protein GXO73_09455 [Calditrichaeota bacterium]|nr:hypothetical protein [Calditrichota bacterium]
MPSIQRKLFWQIPLTILLCVLASLGGVWLVSRALGFDMNPSLVAVLSAVLSAVAISRELRSKPRVN